MGRHFSARPNPKNSDPHACGRLKATGRPTRILSPHRAQCTNPASTRRALKAPGGQDKRRSSKQVQRFEPPPPTRAERPKRANQPAPSCGAFRLPTQKPPTEGVWGAAGVRRQSPRARSLTFRTVGLHHRARWLGRLARESDDLSLDDVQLATAVLQALPRRPDSALHILTGSGRRACTGSPFSRSAPRRSGCRWPASGAATAEAQDHRHVAKKGLPCPWVRPATSRPGRLFCRRLVVNGRVVGEAALPGRAHLSPRTPRPASHLGGPRPCATASTL